MQIGLLGKANVGKSTFFSAATLAPVQTGNFPFTTIRPNIGVAYAGAKCACASLGVTHESSQCSSGTRLIPVGLIDIAGLVPGAHMGRGLGNRFLDDARQADALIHVVDAAGSTDEQGRPVPPGSRDPALDAEFVLDEFDRWFRQVLLREWGKLKREAGRDEAGIAVGIAKRFSGLGVDPSMAQRALRGTDLQAKKPASWTNSDLCRFSAELRRAARPMIVAANKADLCRDGISGRIVGCEAVPCSAETELLLRRAAGAGLVEYVPGSGSFKAVPGARITSQQKRALEVASGVLLRLGDTGVQKAINSAVFGLLRMIAVYPVEDESKFTDKSGTVLPDAKLLPAGSGPRDLAACVHAEIQRGFLYGIDCKTGRKIGAEHILKDGDVIKIVSAGSRG